MPLHLPCPACGLPLAPHAAMCSHCGAALARDAHGQLAVAAAAPPPPNQRACPRCGILNDVKAERCAHCRRHLHQPHRVAGMAILLAIVVLGSLVAVNRWRALFGPGEMNAAKKAEELRAAPAVTPSPTKPPTDDRAAREEFVARLRRDHRESRVKVALSGADLTVITFTGRGFSGNEVEEFTANEEMMGALRALGFRRVIFTTGAGSTWSHSIRPD